MPHDLLCCPVCRQSLELAEREAACPAGHRFDRAREGYLNLLRPGKARKEVIGDDAEMVRARRSFLDRGHYRVLADGLADLVPRVAPLGTLLDVGCGEGTFTAAMLGQGSRPAVAFDISRPAVRLAARRSPAAVCAVATVVDIPVLDHSVDLLVSVMSPIHAAEFARVARPGGRAVIVHPGADHLAELRQVLYGNQLPHDERFETPPGWTLLEQVRFRDQVRLASSEELQQVWGMTPYRWNSPREGAARLAQTSELELSVHFVASVLDVGPPGR